jgi:hypothetical protein
MSVIRMKRMQGRPHFSWAHDNVIIAGWIKIEICQPVSGSVEEKAIRTVGLDFFDLIVLWKRERYSV